MKMNKWKQTIAANGEATQGALLFEYGKA